MLRLATACHASALSATQSNINLTSALGSTGSGPQYATSCAAAYSSYNAMSNAWVSEYETVQTLKQALGGPSTAIVTYYKDAYTLCDGHPRVTKSPAISLSTGTKTILTASASTSTYFQTGFPNFPSPSPTCQIAPSDCDPLWLDYSVSLSAWDAANTTITGGSSAGAPQITAPPQTPPCLNQTAASSLASVQSQVYGCGPCTIYGEGVELVYFPEPTTVSRDMCATTPSAALTGYGPGAVIGIYAGTEYGRNGTRTGQEIATIGKNTFTSGTAYISISSVWAEDRCSSTVGSPIKHAILAMPSQSVLSLRYSQDHFQALMTSSTQTGYPVSYADFNLPVPYSAWIGQAQCQGIGDPSCNSVIYDDPKNGYRPQLAIPPGIRDLNPLWEGCQMWYGGLYDPPRALQPVASVAAPTVPNQYGAPSTAVPSQSITAETATPTAWADQGNGGDSISGWHLSNQYGPPGPTVPDANTATATTTEITYVGSGTAAAIINGLGGDGTHTQGSKIRTITLVKSHTWTREIVAGGQTYTVSANDGTAMLGTNALSFGHAQQTFSNGLEASFGSDGIVVAATSTVPLPQPTQVQTESNRISAGDDPAALVTIDGQTLTAIQSAENAPIQLGTVVLTPGGVPTTLSGGGVVSAGTDGLVVAWESTVAAIATTISGPDGQMLTVAQKGSSAVLADANITTTAPIGADVTFAGMVVTLGSEDSTEATDGSGVLSTSGGSATISRSATPSLTSSAASSARQSGPASSASRQLSSLHAALCAIAILTAFIVLL